jgi:hypothetical protein
MGNFADTLFGVLLGWAKGAVAWLWGAVTNEGGSGLVSWVLDHWLLLLILLCLGGMAIDLVVYIIRWQPYRVWQSYRERRDGAERLENDDQAQEEKTARQWIYADGRTVTEESAPLYAPKTELEETLDAPVRPVKRVMPARRRRVSSNSEELILPNLGEVGDGYHQPYYPPQWVHDQAQKDDGGDAE